MDAIGCTAARPFVKVSPRVRGTSLIGPLLARLTRDFGLQHAGALPQCLEGLYDH